MKTRILLVLLLTGIVSGTMGQNSIDLTFTAVGNTTYVQLDSIKVINRTHGSDTVLYWPDTVLSIYSVGIYENSDVTSEFRVFQNYPNPVTDQTIMSLYVPEKDKVSIIVTDILGRVIIQSERVLDIGKHFFRFTPGNRNLCFFTASWQGQSSSIKVLQSRFYSGGSCTLEYTGSEALSPQLKAIKNIQGFSFSPGDVLLYIGYVYGFESGMLDSPQESQTYTFQLATNIPCPETSIVEYEGQVYNTIQIFNQCWLNENLNVGEMINGTMGQSNNGTIEKYCYNNEPDSCIKYGGLYQWNEMMQYITQQGARGICPPGWHLPTDEEWKVLQGAVDSQYGIGDNIWNNVGYYGYDAGTNLKSTSGWHANGNGTDLFGFSGLPSGSRYCGSVFGVGHNGFWWTSTVNNYSSAWLRYFQYDFTKVNRYSTSKEVGYSVRCLKDY